MRLNAIDKTVSWGVGFAIPLLFVALGVVSLTTQQSGMPLRPGTGRFGLGVSEVSGSTAVFLGIAYLGVAAFLVGWLFHPLRSRWEHGAVGLQVAGFCVASGAIGYGFLFG